MRRKRILAWALSLALLVGMLPGAAFAAEGEPPCENHMEHDAACGYVQGHPCGHTVHTAACYTDELICGYDEEAIVTATGSDADEPHKHTPECYALDCPHERGEHDDTCGYVEAQPCSHECELCATKDSGTTPGTSGQNVQKPTPSPLSLNLPAPKSTLITGDGYSFDPDSGELTVSSDESTYAWRDNSNIDKTDVTSVVVENGVTTLMQGAFIGCPNLASAALPETLTYLEDYAFIDCPNLVLTKLPENVKTIGRMAFSGCTSLALTEIPENVIRIGESAFSGCTGLTSLTFTRPTAPELQRDAFANIPGLVIYVPKGATGYDGSNWPASVTVMDESVTLKEIPGVKAPARGESPVTAITETEQYTGTVTWSPVPSGAFAADTQYTATITLTPKAGFTFNGVPADFFTVAGAETVSNAENSGTVKAVFPKTSAAPTYTISADKTEWNFGSLPAGYATAPDEQTVTVTNTGNQTVTLNQPTATSYNVGPLSKTSLEPGETATFTVQPKTGLAKNTYNETVNISNTQGKSVSVALSFTVTDKSSSGDNGDNGGGQNSGDSGSNGSGSGNSGSNGSSSGSSSGSGYSSRTLTDTASGVKVEGGSIYESATLTVKAGGLHITGDAGCDLLRTADKSGRVLSIYDISLAHVFQGNVTISLPVEGLDGQTLTVAHCIGGKLTLTNGKVENGAVKVTAGGLSPFAVLNGVYTLDTLAAPAAGNPFTDVKESDWYYKAVLYAYQHGLMNGTAAATFDPQGAVTRAQAPVTLYRLEGSPAVTAQNPFADVRPGQWYANGVTWAAGAGLVDGCNANTYGPGDPITREQLAVILYRYAKYRKCDVTERDGLTAYTDAGDVSEWAREAVEWAVGAGLLKGNGGKLTPKAGATRAELAGMLKRLLEKYKQLEALVNPPAEEHKARRYRVQKGDTLWAIARRNGCTLAELVAANPFIKDPSFLLVGWEINIP